MIKKHLRHCVMRRHLIKIITILLLFTSMASAYELTGENLIEPRYWEGNTLIYNDGDVPYSIYSNGYYLGTINPDQGMYVNKTLDYSLYASYDHVRDLGDVDVVKQKFNQWWLIIVIALVIIMFGAKIYKVIIK